VAAVPLAAVTDLFIHLGRM